MTANHPIYTETLVPHLVATLLYLSQIYSYYIRGDVSPLRGNVDCLLDRNMLLSSFMCLFRDRSLINKSNPIMQRMCRPDCIRHKSDIVLQYNLRSGPPQ